MNYYGPMYRWAYSVWIDLIKQKENKKKWNKKRDIMLPFL